MPAIRPAGEADIAAIQAIYAHHVLNGLATFEEVPPDAAEMAARRAEVLARGLPYLAAEAEGRVLGYAYAAPYRARSAYRFAVEDSIYLDPAATGRGIGGALLCASTVPRRRRAVCRTRSRPHAKAWRLRIRLPRSAYAQGRWPVLA